MTDGRSSTQDSAALLRRPRRSVLEMSRIPRATWIRTLLILSLVVLWEVYGRFGNAASFVAPPSAVAWSMSNQIFADPAIRSTIGPVLYEIGAAFALSIVVGLIVGLAIGWTRFGRVAFFPIVILIHAVPQVILLPLFVLFLGIGPGLKIVFGFTHGVFPIIVNVMAGMQTINMLYVRAARAMGASTYDLARDVYFPHMVPAFFTGLRLSMTMTLLGVILAELYASSAGIGHYTRLFSETFRPAPLLALIFTLALIAIALNETVRLAERHFTRWKQ